MDKKLHLHIPECSELWYRQQILSDADTMDYNKGYHLDFEGYHNDTGCIDFPESQWESWYRWFVCGMPDRFYAYKVRNCDDVFIGEVNIHKSTENTWYDMGIVIENKYRGMGYGVEALNLLLAVAFRDLSASAVHNDFDIGRTAAINTHLSAGFRMLNQKEGIAHLCITKEQYLTL